MTYLSAIMAGAWGGFHGEKSIGILFVVVLYHNNSNTVGDIMCDNEEGKTRAYTCTDLRDL